MNIMPSAQNRITELLKNEPAGSFFRVRVLSGGCSGFQYEFLIDNIKTDQDITFETVVIDDLSFSLIEGAELNFVETLAGSSFTLSNPNAASSCGCGNSFSI